MNQKDSALTIRHGKPPIGYIEDHPAITPDFTVQYPPQGRLLDALDGNGDKVERLYDVTLHLSRTKPVATVTQGYDKELGEHGQQFGEGINEVIWGTITYEGPILVMTRNAQDAKSPSPGQVNENQRMRHIRAELRRMQSEGQPYHEELWNPENYESVWTDGELTGVTYIGPDEDAA